MPLLASFAFSLHRLRCVQQLGWRVYQGTTQKFIGAPTPAGDLVSGVWYHIVTTVSGTTMRSYINGVLQGDTAGQAFLGQLAGRAAAARRGFQELLAAPVPSRQSLADK